VGVEQIKAKKFENGSGGTGGGRSRSLGWGGNRTEGRKVITLTEAKAGCKRREEVNGNQLLGRL